MWMFVFDICFCCCEGCRWIDRLGKMDIGRGWVRRIVKNVMFVGRGSDEKEIEDIFGYYLRVFIRVVWWWIFCFN